MGMGTPMTRYGFGWVWPAGSTDRRTDGPCLIIHQHTTQELPTPVEALRHKTVGQIACGSGHTVILTDDGEVRIPARGGVAPTHRTPINQHAQIMPPASRQVWSWGRGDDGRLGHSDCSWKYVPRPVKALQGRSIKQVRSRVCLGYLGSGGSFNVHRPVVSACRCTVD